MIKIFKKHYRKSGSAAFLFTNRKKWRTKRTETIFNRLKLQGNWIRTWSGVSPISLCATLGKLLTKRSSKIKSNPPPEVLKSTFSGQQEKISPS